MNKRNSEVNSLYVNLSGCSLWNDAAKSIAAALSNWIGPPELRLDLRYNFFCHDGYHAIVKALLRNTSVVELKTSAPFAITHDNNNYR